MELRHLKYFLAVAEELHFGKAAAKIHIAQPPLSRQIKQLEQEIGVQLFSRTKRSVELTEAGKIFQLEAGNVLGQLEKAVLKTQRASRGEAGWLGIGFVNSINYDALPRILRNFRRQFPDVELVLQEMQGFEQNQALLDKRIHIGFSRLSIREENLIFEIIDNEPLIAALPASHKLAEKDLLTLADLSNEPFVQFVQQQQSLYPNYIARLFAEAGLKFEVVQKVGELQTALGLVAAEIGITLVPSSVQNLTREGVVYRHFIEPQPTIEMVMQRRRDETSPVVPRFLEIVYSFYHFELPDLAI